MKVGAHYSEEGMCDFVVWAPFRESMMLRVLSHGNREISMDKDEWGYWRVKTAGIDPATRYFYHLGSGIERPDPASFFQPEGVHGASQIVDHGAFRWEDSSWRGIPLSEMIIYELHVGTFTAEGTFDAAVLRLDDIKDVGINTIEIMPVAQFPGKWNWGYDGVYPYAVQNSYGGPNGLKRLVNECHMREISVILDVVYNHLGPEGNYLRDFGLYFTERYKTPWGEAINFDGPYSNEVRNFFTENALYWFEHYHIDSLRLDAIHSIFDTSARPFLQELADRVRDFSQKTRRNVYLISESDLNESKVIRPKEAGGYGHEAVWCDDFHHSLHTLLTNEANGYYVDFGRTDQLVKSLKEGFVFSGEYSYFRKKNHGNSSHDIPAHRFIVFSQNHDQIGNRMFGERLGSLVSFEALKLAAGVVMLSPYIPLLFMGEEYGESAPFLYFIDHSDSGLINAIRHGRKEEFKSFSWDEEPPDPKSKNTFLGSKITWEDRHEGKHRILLNLYSVLIRYRREIPALSHPDKNSLDVWSQGSEKVIIMRRFKCNSETISLFNFEKRDCTLRTSIPGGHWIKLLDSSDKQWNGSGSLLPEEITTDNEMTMRADSFALYKMVRQGSRDENT